MHCTDPSEYYGSTAITAGLKSFGNIFLAIENAAEDAFQASLSFILPTNLLELVNVFNQTRNGEVSRYNTPYNLVTHYLLVKYIGFGSTFLS